MWGRVEASQERFKDLTSEEALSASKARGRKRSVGAVCPDFCWASVGVVHSTVQDQTPLVSGLDTADRSTLARS